MQRLKNFLIKAIDVTALTFLEPVVRLCYGEEPRLQLQKIGKFIVVPILAFIAFLLAWTAIAPVHKTKSGQVPTPAVVANAAEGIWTFHKRERDKKDAMAIGGESRVAELAQVEARLKELEPLAEEADRKVKQAEELVKKRIAAAVDPVVSEYEAKKKEFKDAQDKRVAALRTKAAKLEAGDLEARNEYLAYVRGHVEQCEAEDEKLSDLKSRETELRAEKYPELAAALGYQTEIAEEQQYLVKKRQLLSEDNRNVKLAKEVKKLNALKKEFATSTGPGLYNVAQDMVKIDKRVRDIAESEYAKPMTLPSQVLRSLACVFCGFLFASAIAIPIGVLCGLSKVFMAAVTPFIALFKPVSPIVWLPISLIVVGGFIPDPDKHWLIELLAELPLIGWMQINPAFIASAITVALCSLWPTLTNTALGVASIDKDHINVARVLQLGFFERLFKIVIPSALPLIFAGLRISLGVGWMVLIAAELLSSSEGIGKFVWDMFNNGSSATFAQMFVVVFVVGIIGLMLDRIMIIFQRLVSFDVAPASI